MFRQLMGAEAAPFLLHEVGTPSSGDADHIEHDRMENRRAEAEGAAAPSV
jgi:hypothetical protein